MFREPGAGLIQQVKNKATVAVQGDPAEGKCYLPVLGAALNHFGYSFRVAPGDTCV